MIYKPFQDLKLSALGMGAMRLPIVDGVFTDIDVPAVEKMVDYAVGHGVNYFDTAYGYHDGRSEGVMGRVLSAYPRDSFYLADKFPGYDLANIPKVEEIFEEQLRRCGVTYFDFYLFHNVCEMNIDAYLDRQYGIYDYLLRQKAEGLHPPSRLFGAWQLRRDAALSRRLRREHGIRAGTAQLHRLDLPERGGEGKAPQRAGHPRLGHGAAARRQAGGAAGRIGGGAAPS